ncbi:anti-repressor SinI family protein [Fervidibacillus halotolerans]|uniref:Anti-repressor SinI family protein n=1 Tax=Fervidibacillus halotolerans TaxID=2980027 RepID=A0A9E8S0K1_9BACI|nr:anti-repressor SinI family protein [Fervidibacillus halotolerans]WAA12662.1 anti-repressor SinI family protein [Fervidibacillus halotolerans]
MKKSQMSQVVDVKKTEVVKKYLDPEWVELIKEAKRYGIPINEIRNFLRKGSL